MNLLTQLTAPILMLFLLGWGLASLRGTPFIIEFPPMGQSVGYIILILPALYGLTYLQSGVSWIRSQLKKGRVDD